MKQLFLSGKINNVNKHFDFTFKNGLLRIYDWIRAAKDINFSKSNCILYGSTNTGNSVCFVNCKVYSKDRILTLETDLVILSGNVSLSSNTLFNSIRFSGGSLNDFGDIVREIIKSDTGAESLETFKRGFAKFEYRPTSETSINFYDPSVDTEHSYSFSTNRHFLLTDETITDFNRSFFYRAEPGFYIDSILNQIINMLNFISLLSWKNNIAVGEIGLGITQEDGLNFQTARVYTTLPVHKQKKMKHSILDYKSDNNALGKLYEINKKLEKSHLFILNDTHHMNNFDSKDILNSVVTFEQILDIFSFKKTRMNPNIKNLRNEIINSYSGNEYFQSLEKHLVNFRGTPLKDSVHKIIEDYPNVIDIFIRNGSYNTSLDPEKTIKQYINNTIDFRNEVVHSSKFDISKRGLYDGTLFFRYMSYYIILTQAKFDDKQATTVLNKIFNFV